MVRSLINKILKRVSEEPISTPQIRKKTFHKDEVGWINFHKSHLLFERKRLQKHELVIYKPYYDSSGILFRGKRKLK